MGCIFKNRIPVKKISETGDNISSDPSHASKGEYATITVDKKLYDVQCYEKDELYILGRTRSSSTPDLRFVFSTSGTGIAPEGIIKCTPRHKPVHH